MNGDALTDELLAPDRLAIALRILTMRVARWVVLAMSFALFSACMYRPSPLRLATASVFTLLASLPIWLRKEN